MNEFVDAPDAFGDPFLIEDLSLPRHCDGYAVQWLGRDRLLDQSTGAFLPVRHPALQAIFQHFCEARAAASHYCQKNKNRESLAIVPVAFDEQQNRHILLYGVLEDMP